MYEPAVAGVHSFQTTWWSLRVSHPEANGLPVSLAGSLPHVSPVAWSFATTCTGACVPAHDELSEKYVDRPTRG